MLKQIHERVRLLIRIFLYEILILVSFPLLLVFGLVGLILLAISTLILLPREIYRSYYYKNILIHYLKPDECEYIQCLIDFYAHHKDCASKLVKDCIKYIDNLYQANPQKYVKYRYEFCVFIGKICSVVLTNNMKSNREVHEYMEEINFQTCKDPNKFFGTLKIEDIKIFKDE